MGATQCSTAAPLRAACTACTRKRAKSKKKDRSTHWKKSFEKSGPSRPKLMSDHKSGDSIFVKILSFGSFE